MMTIAKKQDTILHRHYQSTPVRKRIVGWPVAAPIAFAPPVELVFPEPTQSTALLLGVDRIDNQGQVDSLLVKLSVICDQRTGPGRSAGR